MKKLSKVVAMLLVCLSVAPTFTGCSKDEISLLDAISKNQEINSMEAKINTKIQLNISGLPEEQQQQAFLVTQMLNNTNITTNEKVVKDSKTGTVKGEILNSFSIAGMSSNANIWVETGISDGTPKVKEIFQLPAFATMALQDMAGKEYLVLDTSKVPGQTDELKVFDYSKYNELSKEITAETTKFCQSYVKNLKPGFTLISNTGSKTINGSNVSTYQLKMSDSQLKDLINFIVKDLGTNKDNLNLIEEYITSIMKLSMSVNPQANVSEEEMKQAFSEIESQIPAFLQAYSKYSDALKNIKLLGEDGITIDYAVNKDGYIVNEDSKIDLNIDLGQISKAVEQISGQTSQNAPSGIISLKLSSSTEISKINENVEVNLPEVNDNNSVNYFTLLNKMAGIEEKPVNNDIVSVFVNGKYVKFKDAPVILNDRTMVPAREVIETLGGTVDWDDATQTVTAKFGSNTAAFTMNSDEALVNGQAVKLDSPAQLYKDRFYIPLRVLTNSIGAKLTWDENTNSAYID